MKYLPIHILRSTCHDCKRDTMRTFVCKEGEDPSEAFKQMETWVKARWPTQYGCVHRISFHWTTDKEYKWNIKKKEAVKV